MEKRSVLFADDDRDFRSFMKDAIEEVSKNIETELIITEAQDGAEAIKLFDESINQKKPFDIVVTDYMMPSASGLQVIKHIIKTNPVPIIVMSAYKEAETVDFIKEGAIIFISKPFQFAQIISAFSEAVSLSLVEEDIKKAEESIKELEKLTS
ncbi:MAG: response regulator [Candidatus Helarchaeota archaeon]|nr:response regulator [Candidatus Helarchaeota archaeon]